MASKQIEDVSLFFNVNEENLEIKDFQFTKNEMINAINKTRSHSSPGPDGWATLGFC
jgi:hypothetical protein